MFVAIPNDPDMPLKCNSKLCFGIYRNTFPYQANDLISRDIRTKDNTFDWLTLMKSESPLVLDLFSIAKVTFHYMYLFIVFLFR